MKKTMVLSPITGPKAQPITRTYNYKECVATLNRTGGELNFIPAEKVSLYNHLVMAEGQIYEILNIISTEKGM